MDANSTTQLSSEISTFGLAHYTAEHLSHILGKHPLSTSAFFVIVWTENQEIRARIDYTTIDIPANHLLFVGPYREVEVLTGLHEDIQVFIFSQSFYEQSSLGDMLLNSVLFFDERPHIAPVTVSPPQFRALIINRLNRFKRKKIELYTRMAHNCIEAMILNALLHFPEADSTKAETSANTTDLAIVNRFRLYLQKHYKTARKVAFYAELLHITPRRLTQITERLQNQTAKQLITEKLISECERLLNHSDLTISQISNELGFYDESNFCAFVKKQTGMTPSAYRTKTQKKGIIS